MVKLKSKKCGIRESDEQIRIFEFSEFHPKLRWMFAIPNGGYRDIREATRLKKQGVKSGVSDMFLPVPNSKYHGLFIELKVGKNKATTLQEEFIDFVRGQGYKAEVCYGADEAIHTILNYLECKND